jgi:hypothetical protein
LADADNTAWAVVTIVGPCVDHENRHSIDHAHRVPAITVWVRIGTGNRKRIGKGEFAHAKW